MMDNSAEDIRRDIDYHEVLLANLGHPISDPETRRRAELDLATLKDQLKMKEAQTMTNHKQDDVDNIFAAYDSGSSAGLPPLEQPLQCPHTSDSNYNFDHGFGAPEIKGHFASDGALMGQAHLRQTPLWSFSPAEPTYNIPSMTPHRSSSIFTTSSTTASSAGESPLDSSPVLPTMPGTGRKRLRESLDLSHLTSGHGTKAMRGTPSPAPTGPTTPSSMASFDFPEDSDLFNILGGNPKDHLREMLKDQKERERELRERKEQERRDEEFALKMQAEQYRPSSGSSATQTFGVPSSLSRPSSQSILDNTGRFRRPDLPTVSNAFNSPVKYEGFVKSSATPPIKKERHPPTGNKASINEFPNIIDLGSSDDESDAEKSHPSSDVMEIGATSFQPSDRNAFSNASTFSTPNDTHNDGIGGTSSWTDIDQTPTTDFQAWHSPFLSPPNPYQDLTGYGGASVYTPSATSYPSAFANPWSGVSYLGQGISNLATGAMNGAYRLLDDHINSYPGASAGYGGLASSIYGASGSSTNPQLIDSSTKLGVYSQPRQHSGNNILPTNPYANDPNNREAYQEYLDRVNYLSSSTRTTTELRSLLENIRPDEQLDPRTRVGTPDSMSVTSPLYEHQKLGLTWLQNMEEGSNKGGILADDMGLGKTVQALALMVTRRSSDPSRRTTLIVAPVALLKQWEREIELRLKPGPEHRLTTFIYHSKGKKATWEVLKKYDVVLTTYGTLGSEFKRKEHIDIQKRANPNWRPLTENDRLPLLGDECKWYRIILDEAQCIKNRSTKAAKAASELQALSRFCMSGTPMMNNVTELYSLIHFLRIKPYNSQEKFNVDFTRPLKSNSPTAKDQAMRKLQALLKAILLRRTKKSMIDGKPILELPERVTEIQHAVFSDDENAVYRSLESQTQLQFNRYLKAGKVGKYYSNMLVLLLRLRQACCHPHLIDDFGVSAGGEVATQDLLALAKDLSAEVIERIKAQGPIECPICMDSAENATIFIPCGHSTCLECFTKISDPQPAVADGDGNNAVKCPNCRGKIDPKRVTDYSSFKKVHMPHEAEEDGLLVDQEADIETASDSDSDSDTESDSGSLTGFIVNDDNDDEDDDGYNKGKTPFEKAMKKPKTKKERGLEDKGKAKEEKRTKKTLQQLKKESKRSAKARRKYLKRLESDWETSAKIEKVLEILQSVQERKGGEKTIIFSQFTSLLDLLEIPINKRDWGYRRYDGSMTAIMRNDAVIDFSDKPDCKILLVSLKAGNAGLNLTAASQVIIFDPFWNPYIEEQAIDRAHRIGQRLPVQVHRILVPNTVEDRIVLLQEKKRALIEGALDEKASQSIGRLGTRELAFLFGVPYQG